MSISHFASGGSPPPPCTSNGALPQYPTGSFYSPQTPCLCKRVSGPQCRLLSKYLNRGFIKGRALGKLTGCEQDLAINLPGYFHLLFLLSFIRKTKNARLKNPTDLLHKNVMKPLLHYTLNVWSQRKQLVLFSRGS